MNYLAHSGRHRKCLNLFQGQEKLIGLQNADSCKLWEVLEVPDSAFMKTLSGNADL